MQGTLRGMEYRKFWNEGNSERNGMHAGNFDMNGMQVQRELREEWNVVDTYLADANG